MGGAGERAAVATPAMPGRQRVAWGTGGKAAAGSTHRVLRARRLVDYPSMTMAGEPASGDSNQGHEKIWYVTYAGFLYLRPSGPVGGSVGITYWEARAHGVTWPP